MDEEEYQKLYQFEENHWWYQGIWDLIIEHINRQFPKKKIKILDVGCGSGAMMKMLSQFGDVWGIDSSKIALKYCCKRGLKNIQLAKGEKLPFKENTFDFVIIVDVLCQMSISDLNTLKEINRVLRPGGILILNEPAFEWLRGRHDLAVGAVRRYSKQDIHQKLVQANFQIERITHRGFLLFPLFLIYRLATRNLPPRSDFKRAGEIENWLGKINNRIENYLLKYINLPYGLSVFGVGRK